MEIYPRTAAERAMKLQEVLLRATSGKIKWWQAAELIGISERQMRRWRKRLEDQGPKGLLDRRRRTPNSRRVPKEQAEFTSEKEVGREVPFRMRDIGPRHSRTRFFFCLGRSLSTTPSKSRTRWKPRTKKAINP